MELLPKYMQGNYKAWAQGAYGQDLGMLVMYAYPLAKLRGVTNEHLQVPSKDIN